MRSEIIADEIMTEVYEEVKVFILVDSPSVFLDTVEDRIT